MLFDEATGDVTRRPATEMRRHAREAGRWPIVLETREGHLLQLPLIDLSPGGAKVRLMAQLTEGTTGRVYFLPPHWHARAVEALVWRLDLDGIVLRFTDVSLDTPPPAQAPRRTDGDDNG